jgi:NAD+ diphosphatase
MSKIWPDAQTEFLSKVIPPEKFDRALYFVFHGAEILQNFDSSGQWTPLESLKGPLQDKVVQSHYLGDLAGVACFAVEAELDPDRKDNLRSLFGKCDNQMFSLAGLAVQILDWYRTNKYCGRCGKETTQHDADRAMVCEDCKIHSYPRLSPSIITLVHDEKRVLLARNHRFPEGMYSTLAGFVEPGESIEETVRREVHEEVGVKVGSLEYMGSQPWPFPNSLMLGFLAEYESGDIVLQEEEIAEANWYEIDQLPGIPGNVAISRWLIDSYLARMGIAHEDD